jgi:Flp pilus assembly protein TadD
MPPGETTSSWLDQKIQAHSPEPKIKSDQDKKSRALIAYQTADKLFGKRHYKQALVAYNVAIDIQPDFSEAYNGRGATNLALGNVQLALDDASRSTRLNANNAIAYYLRGVISYKIGNTKLAKSDLIMAAQLFKEQGNQKEYRIITNLLDKID